MTYLLGTSDDSTTRYFAATAAALRRRIEWVDLAELVSGRWHVDTDGAADLRAGSRRVIIPSGAPVYARLIEANCGDSSTVLSARSRALLAALASWLELSPGRVVNRPGHRLDNACKPLHEALLLRSGFNVPASLTSSDPIRLRAFAQAFPVVVKTISGIRADCRRVDASEFVDFHPDQGPVHLQQEIDGYDVRVHVVATRTISVGIRAVTVDYRMAADAAYCPCDLPRDVAERVVEATGKAGLAFAGWDFKVDRDGTFHALEANPMPGYHMYDRVVRGAITEALLDHLEEAP